MHMLIVLLNWLVLQTKESISDRDKARLDEALSLMDSISKRANGLGTTPR